MFLYSKTTASQKVWRLMHIYNFFPPKRLNTFPETVAQFPQTLKITWKKLTTLSKQILKPTNLQNETQRSNYVLSSQNHFTKTAHTAIICIHLTKQQRNTEMK